MRLYFVAGEASGDAHGAALIAALQRMRPDLHSLGRGGPLMQKLAGSDLHNWIDQAGVVGLWEVLKQYRYFRREFRKTLAEISDAKPDAVVLIDYPGFNLRLARELRRRSLGGKIIFYISPQVWAWNRRRIPKMARWLDLMLCIFPFEAALYQQSGLPTIFVGHPMIENLEAKRGSISRETNFIGLFPGSRAREVRKLMPILVEVMGILKKAQPELRFEIAAASENLAQTIRSYLPSDSLGHVALHVGETARIMQQAAAGVVASGTATLEAAFFRMPFALVYKVSALTYLAGKMVIRVNHLGMPNVLAGREIVPEFLQGNARPDAIAAAVQGLLANEQGREKMIADFDEVIAKLPGGANEKAAGAILETLTVK